MLHACEAARVIQHRCHDQLCFQEVQRRHDETMLDITQDIKTTAYEVKIIGFVFGFIEGQKADLKNSDSFSIEEEGEIQYDLDLFAILYVIEPELGRQA